MTPDDPERYEHFEAPRYRFAPVEPTVFDRRDFMKLAGGGIVVFVAASKGLTQETGGGRGVGVQAMPSDIGAWLSIDRTGKVTAYTGKVEIGQNARTSLTQAIAEELRIPPAAVTMIMGDTALTPYDVGTFGSMTTPIMGTQLRKAAAAARELLVDVAAARWKVDRRSLVAENGSVDDRRRARSVSYGELAAGQKLLKTIDRDVELTPPTEWRIAGTSLPKVTGRDVVTGRHKYTSDMSAPGMLYGVILRPLRLTDTLRSLDSTAASQMPDVTIVHDGNFVGVTAPTLGRAIAARNALRATWHTTGHASSRELFSLLKDTADPKPDEIADIGSVDEAVKSAHHLHTASYRVAYIAHAPLEPRAALASWSEGRAGTLTVMTGTQRPFGVQSELAAQFQISPERVRVQVPDTGSAYGGKHTGDAAIEAARLARATGRPVRVVWSRDEEFTWGYFRPAGVIDIRSAVSREGKITAWEHDNYNSGPAGIRTMYDVPNQRIRFHRAESPLRQGSYRGLAATANHFAREMSMDDLARAIDLDPLEFRKRNLKDPRLGAVLDAAASRFGWPGIKSPTEAAAHGFGIAGGFEKGSYVATCAEVAVDRQTERVKVVRLVTSFECGAIVNPDGLRNQIEGGLVQATGAALWEGIHFNDGQIIETNFHDYHVPRFADTPDIEVVLLDRRDLPPAGAGETPTIVLAAALGNAIFDAIDKRIRELPLNPRPLILGSAQ